jgi:hypothetical protein
LVPEAHWPEGDDCEGVAGHVKKLDRSNMGDWFAQQGIDAQELALHQQDRQFLMNFAQNAHQFTETMGFNFWDRGNMWNQNSRPGNCRPRCRRDERIATRE